MVRGFVRFEQSSNRTNQATGHWNEDRVRWGNGRQRGTAGRSGNGRQVIGTKIVSDRGKASRSLGLVLIPMGSVIYIRNEDGVRAGNSRQFIGMIVHQLLIF
eukprot:TRINITY_DN1195_c0_g1_i3.p2 TRINITY_DN1195_c0_g1~~TRINITY_DN1195_c0_g1_i3.p2  ORF type:complete len:102 (-),score=11.12 TRINITY_DN1195_c0_g1_i3:169-474(-)